MAKNQKTILKMLEGEIKYNALRNVLILVSIFTVIQNIFAVYSLDNIRWQSLTPLFAQVFVTLFLLVALIKTKKTAQLASILLLVNIPTITFRALDTGGIYSNIILWFYCLPIVALFFGSRRLMYSVLGFSCVNIGWLAYKTSLNFDQMLIDAAAFGVVGRVFFFLAPLFFMILFIILLDRERERGMLLLQKHQDQSITHLKLASISEISGGLAHEINNPLNNIKGLLHLSKRKLGKETPSKKDFIKLHDQLSENVERVAIIVSSLQKIAKDRSGSDKEVIIFKEIIESVKRVIRGRKESNLIDIGFSSNSDINTFEGHRVLIEQILINLLFNSIDAVVNRPNPTIRLNWRCTAEELFFEVIDNGNGIPYENREKIYLPFFSTKEVGKGTGLGLSLVKGILDAHNGKISFITSDIGTTFQVRFPLID